jgi:protein-tyrosine phosphatase
MKKILFVCLGNICRSPAAEMIMKHLLRDSAVELYIDSAGTNPEGSSSIYYATQEKLLEKNIPVDKNSRSRQLLPEDYQSFDYLIVMETENARNVERIVGPDLENKVTRLLDYTNNPGDIADPWFSRDFETAHNEIYLGCTKLLEALSLSE